MKSSGSLLVLVTGGSSGIGKAAAIQLARQGAEIIIQARSLDKLKEAAKEIESYGARKVHFYSTDLTDATKVEAAARSMVAEIGLPDVVINSAGSGMWLSMEESTLDHYRETIESPYLATVYTCKAFYDLMKARGTGHFVIVNSIVCYGAIPKAIGYTASRYAMLGLARAMRADLYGSGFDVSFVGLGKVNSPYFQTNPGSEDRIPGILNLLSPSLSEEKSGKIVAAVVKSKRRAIVRPVQISFLVWLNRFFPGIFRWAMRVGN